MDRQKSGGKKTGKYLSPENLDEYIKVTNPGIWIMLAAILILLAGVLIWGVFGKMENTVSVPALVSGNQAVCTPDSRYISSIEEGMTVKIDRAAGTVTSVDAEQGIVYADINAADGEYTAEIIIEEISPIYFITN